MPGRTDTTPLLIRKGRAVALTRVPFQERQFDEGWLQELLFQNPLLIPVDEIEPVFAPLIPVARELPTPSGPLDVLYLSPEGYPTLVETKLWRNPEARRQVVAQAIDYATQLSRWSYEDLVNAVRSVRPDRTESDPLAVLVAERTEEFDHAQFVDTVTRNLRRGRMLLLIVGDGIHEAVEHMAQTLGGTPQLGFTLGLVEMAVFRAPDEKETLFVQPRVVARTREVIRAVVEIREGIRPEDVKVTLPETEEPKAAGQRYRLTEEAFFERLGEATSAGTAAHLQEFIAATEAEGVTILTRQASLSLHYVEPATGKRFSLGSVYTDGRVDMYYVAWKVQTAGLSVEIAKSYLNSVAGLVPKARVEMKEASNREFVSAIKVGRRPIQIDELLPHAAQWQAAIAAMIQRINEALESES